MQISTIVKLIGKTFVCWNVSENDVSDHVSEIQECMYRNIRKGLHLSITIRVTLINILSKIKLRVIYR